MLFGVCVADALQNECLETETCNTLRSPQRGVRSTFLFHLILWNPFLYVELHYQMLGFASVVVIHATIWHSAQHSEHPTRQASVLNTEPRI